MKTYTIKQLQAIAKQQGYKMAALENSQGERVQSFNPVTKKIEMQFQIILQRLSSEIVPNGVYYVLMAQAINRTKNADRYPVVKGKLSAEDLQENKQPITIIKEHSQEVLTWSAALEMQKEIATLTSENKQLKFENNLLQIEVEALQNAEPEVLAETEPSNILTYLKDIVPSLMPLADRYFDIEEKKLNLQELKINGASKKQFTKRVPITTGSQEHMNLIEHYFKTDNEEKLNIELDKLEQADLELYKKVCEKLEIELGEENENE